MVGFILKPDTTYLEHNILLYVENLKAEVSGQLQYSTIEDPEVVHTVKINKFILDIGLKDQHIIKNHTFKEFWNYIDDVEQMIRMDPNISVQQLHDQIERQVHSEDER